MMQLPRSLLFSSVDLVKHSLHQYSCLQSLHAKWSIAYIGNCSYSMASRNPVHLKADSLKIMDMAIEAVSPAQMVRNSVKRHGDTIVVEGKTYELNRNIHVLAFGKVGHAAELKHEGAVKFFLFKTWYIDIKQVIVSSYI